MENQLKKKKDLHLYIQALLAVKIEMLYVL